MKLPFTPSSLKSVSKRSELHHRTAAGGVDDSKSKDGLEGFIAASANPAAGAEVNFGKAKSPPRTSTTPKATQEFLDRHAQRNPPRAEDTPTLNPFAQTAVFGARSPQTTSTSSLICNEDNALRGLMRFPDEAHTFCPLFLGPRQPDGHGLATFVGQYQPPEVSSACSCFESKLITGCCTLTATTGDPSLQALIQSVLKSTDKSDASRATSTSSSRNPATEDATFARPTEHWGPMTSEVTVTAEWLGPTSILGFSISSTASETVTSTRAPALTSGLNTTETSAAGAAAVVGNASVWLGGGEVPAPEVVAVIVILPLIVVAVLVWLVWRRMKEA